VVSYFQTILLAIKNNDIAKGTPCFLQVNPKRQSYTQPEIRPGWAASSWRNVGALNSKRQQKWLLEDLSDFALYSSEG
jgi:hypothetical protein